MKDIRQDLEDRLALLRVRYEVAFHTKSGDRDPGSLAYTLELGLHAELDNSVEMVRALIDPCELESAKFWGTPLGVLLFSAGGYIAPAVSQTVAASVLTCSRQYVHELVLKGALRSETGVNPKARQVHSGDVRDLLRRKLDRLVNHL